MDAVWTGPTEHIQAEQANAGAAIEDEGAAIFSMNFDTRRVATINSCSVSRCGNRAACTPKTNVHHATFSALCHRSGVLPCLSTSAIFSTVHMPVKHIVAVFPAYV